MIIWRNFIPKDSSDPIHVAPFSSEEDKKPMIPHVIDKDCPCSPEIRTLPNGRVAVVHKITIQ